jgi:hypothetical protein
MAQYPDNEIADTNKGEPLTGYQHQQPDQTMATGKKQIIDGQALINQNAPGKLNENRFTSLEPSKQSK